MNTVLAIIASLLGLVSVALFFRHKTASRERQKVKENPQRTALLTVLVVGGTVMAVGGFWIEGLLWGGLILTELGCIAHYLMEARPLDA